ncbi:hypothetical protein QBC43DRAFT_142521 [Cladorrhinum sp. PSN259]|nr:hypothetical protein QBC43DRAFT_142521 [Cladorrhinum sp. PSN259]
MTSPIQFQVDLNEIVKKVVGIFQDIRNFERDCADFVKDFHREVAWTEFHDGILKTHLLRNSNTILNSIGNLQRTALVDAVNDVYRGWTELYTLLEQLSQNSNHDAGPVSSNTWPTTTGTTKTIAKVAAGTGRPWRAVSWVWKRKSSVQRIMSQIKLSNQFLDSSIQAICSYYEAREPESVIRLAGHSSSTDQPQSGLSAQITRLAIRRDRTPTDMALLRETGYLDLREELSFGTASRLHFALAAGCKPVLVEYLPSTDFSRKTIDRAVRLAMLLKQPAVHGFAVLPCLGLCLKPDKERIELIYDLTGPRREMAQDGNTPSAESILSRFHSLQSQLSKADKNGALGVLRHYKPHEATTKPISMGQRLALAVQLAQTLQHLQQTDWVHGNINSNNIYLFLDKKVPETGLPVVRIDKCFLFGFQFSRLNKDYSDTGRRSTLPPKDNLHRHPDRRIMHEYTDGKGAPLVPDKPHQPHHDIYSLGVVLLELGLGRTAEDLLKLAPHLSGDLACSPPDLPSALEVARGLYIALADNFLPGEMGNSYASVTRTCLDGYFEDLGGHREGAGSGADETMNLPTAFRLCVIEPLVRMMDLVG